MFVIVPLHSRACRTVMIVVAFRRQVRSIMGQVRPDRQTLLFSATMPRKVEGLVRDALSAPIRITIGAAG